MAKPGNAGRKKERPGEVKQPEALDLARSVATSSRPGKPSSLLDTRVVYCGDNLEQLAKLPGHCIDLIYIDPSFNSKRNYEVFWGSRRRSVPLKTATPPRRPIPARRERPRCFELARVLKQMGLFRLRTTLTPLEAQVHSATIALTCRCA